MTDNHTSIRISPASETARYASEIRGRLEENKVVIAVEGDDDLKIDRRLFRNNVAIIPTYGKIGIDNLCVELFNTYPQNLIAIKDADFDHLNGVIPVHKNIFLTDKHDMEMTMLDSDIVYSIIAEHMGTARNFDEISNGQQVIDLLSNNIKDYSYIKWYNNVANCGINFNVITMAGINAGNSSISIADALTLLYSNDVNNREEVVRVSEQSVTDFKSQHPCDDLSLLICGHDFTSAMLVWMRLYGFGTKLSRTELERDIRLLYTSEKFRTTTLYQLLHQWEMDNEKLIVA